MTIPFISQKHSTIARLVLAVLVFIALTFLNITVAVEYFEYMDVIPGGLTSRQNFLTIMTFGLWIGTYVIAEAINLLIVANLVSLSAETLKNMMRRKFVQKWNTLSLSIPRTLSLTCFTLMFFFLQEQGSIVITEQVSIWINSVSVIMGSAVVFYALYVVDLVVASNTIETRPH